MKTQRVWIAVLVASLAAGVCVGEERAPLLLATAQELLDYPDPLSAGAAALSERLFAVAVPGTDLVVLVRPMTESEFASFQVQAIDAQLIDLEMLAATIVLPVVAPVDVAGFAPDLVALLHRTINGISGFAVFDAALSP